MPAQVAILLGCIGVGFLFYLDRDKSTRTSRALWVPIVWIGLLGSRPVSMWFGITPPNSPSANLDGSPVDAAVFGILIVIGTIILIGRKRKTASYLAALVPVIAYFVYCLSSVGWSPVPVPSLKRWLKDIGDFIMVLIVMTDPDPFAALRRLYSRISFILFPFSIVLIRWTTLGRAWNNDGLLSNVGVTTDKNMLGVIVYLTSLGVLWNFRWLLVNRGVPNRGRRLLGQGVLLMFGVYLLITAHSSTSLACFLLGSGLMLTTHLRAIKRQPSRVFALGIGIFVLGGLAIAVGGAGDVANALGRDSSFSGRTVIWAALIPTVTNPFVGTGFDSYWNSPNEVAFARTLNDSGWYHAELLNEAHDGYLEVYLNLGLIGLCLIVTILASGYSRACKVFTHDHELGSVLLAYIVPGMIYNVTEAGFRTLSASWVFMLLAIVGARGASAGLVKYRAAKLRDQQLARLNYLPTT